MPSLKASSKVNMAGWQQQISSPDNGNDAPDPGTTPDPETRNPFMHASMPLMASTNDALSQYYSTANTPQQRILPARPGGAVM